MHDQLERLLEIQDLRTQHRALSEETDERIREVESDVFAMKVEEAVAALEDKIEELESQLDAEVRSRYRRLVGARQRSVVPVIDGICYGCFVAVPTAMASKSDRNERITVCDHCGRFLYYVA